MASGVRWERMMSWVRSRSASSASIVMMRSVRPPVWPTRVSLTHFSMSKVFSPMTSLPEAKTWSKKRLATLALTRAGSGSWRLI